LTKLLLELWVRVYEPIGALVAAWYTVPELRSWWF